jgi:glycine/D-amino acid oxidase-like deaminating enzyme/nitrite reductase/ring-hydroxylating ferredoxin subunit
MTIHHGETTSIWQEHYQMPVCLPLKEDFRTDVCIVGAGIAGLTTAYLLMKEGLKVCVLDSSELASGQSGRTTAHFSNALDDRFFNLESYHGEDGLKLAIQSHSDAIRKVEEIVKKENIDCNLKRLSGYLFSLGDKKEDVLEKEYEAAHKGGLIDVERFAFSPNAAFHTGPCLHFPMQMKLHPLKYLGGLTQKILDGGGQIFTNTHVTEVKGGENAFVKTKNNCIVYCSSIVMATNTPVNDRMIIHTKQAAYRTYVLGFEIPKGSFPDVLLWDTLDPYHYVRLESQSNRDILIVGGEDHKTGQEDNPEKCYKALTIWTKQLFPFIRQIVYKWSGQVMEPVDGLAYLGRNPMDEENVYIITGDSGHGMTHCTIGAMLITDQIMGRENPWEKLYSPSRVSLMAAKNFIKENANVAAQYTEWLDPKFKKGIDDLPQDEGVVFRKNGKMIAAYKTLDGEVEYMSAVCPHLAGVVAWNKAEKSWDCPCHGSRFDCHGAVIEGPSISGLKKFENHQLKKEKHDVQELR